MSRYLHKSWQDKRPGWTRRVRWYEGVPIRLNFIDQSWGEANLFFDTAEAAQEAYDRFVNGASIVQISYRPERVNGP